MKKKHLTPRSYISWSQFSLIERDPEMYRQIYFRGEPSEESAAMSFGKRFAKALEEGTSDEPAIEYARLLMPDYQKREYEMKADLKTDKKITLLGKFDGYNPKTKDKMGEIGEFKTGRTKWNQNIADKNEQLTFYALIYWLKFGQVPILNLHWYNTDTGDIRTFITYRDIPTLMRMAGKARNAWHKILAMAEDEVRVNKSVGQTLKAGTKLHYV